MLTMGLGSHELASSDGQSVREDAGGTRHRRSNHLNYLFDSMSVQGLAFLHELKQLVQDPPGLFHGGGWSRE
jgi:hypothetical protein